MKKLSSFLLVSICALFVSCSSMQKSETSGSAVQPAKTAATAFAPFAVYVENASKDNHFAPSGWMGDYGDIKLNLACTEMPRNGNTCIKITYNPMMSQGAGWTGIFWQQPANNWGDKKGGYNLTGAKKLSFWARGANGGEKISEFKVGGITGEYPDSDSQSMGPVELTKEWQQYTLDLEGKDLSYIIGGFAFSASKDDNPNGFVIYFDDIIFE
ncbi:MAG: hypothetical protein PHN29_06590 [Endomicrobiaceae bacterium]|jgi:hypothetical protein|nr:hypothetical protein [Endomicrobiaceae bacterium]